tara:strand:- start:79 stop:480 length:402 start_codon:yes stop_codon:yes gene_type:complete
LRSLGFQESVESGWEEVFWQSLKPHSEVGRANELDRVGIREAKVCKDGRRLRQGSDHAPHSIIHASLQHLDVIARQKGSRVVQVWQCQGRPELESGADGEASWSRAHGGGTRSPTDQLVSDPRRLFIEGKAGI